MKAPVLPFDKRIFAAYVICSLIAIFYLPTLVPLSPTRSLSYTFGYNNRVGIVLLLLLTTVGVMWTKGLNLKFSSANSSRSVSSRILILALIGVFCGCLAMYVVAGRFGGFGESSYGIDRTWLLSQGKTPYIDFEWPFGIALLYGPLLLSRLFSTGIAQASYIFWGLTFLLGTIILHAVVNLIDYPTNSKKAIFLLLYLAGLLSIINMGTHYTFLRYTSPLYFILLIQKLIYRNDNKSIVYAVILASIFTIALFLVSPETAIAFAFASVCVILFDSHIPARLRFASLAGLVTSLAVIFGTAMKLHVLDTLKASGGGADSFPIIFAPHILLFFFAIFVCACYVFRRFADRTIHDNTIGLIAYSIPMIAAALGRCDVLHVGWNGEGLFLASMVYVSNYKTPWKWYKATFLVVMILIPALNTAVAYSGPLASVGADLLRDRGDNSRTRALLGHLGESSIALLVKPDNRPAWEAKLHKAERPAIPDLIDFSALYPMWHGRFLAPFGYRPHGEGFGSYLSNEIDFGHYQGFENANTRVAIHEKLGEIEAHPEEALLLPDHFEQGCVTDASAQRHSMESTFFFPYFGRTVHTDNVRKQVCDYILARYSMEQKPDLENFDYGLWVAEPNTASR